MSAGRASTRSRRLSIARISTDPGGPTDRPVVGDYDGDGRADLAVDGAATGVWDILLSSTSYTRSLKVHLGIAGDMPVPGDYDRNGKTDVAIFRPATGTWSVPKSSTNFARGLRSPFPGARVATSRSRPITTGTVRRISRCSVHPPARGTS
jgi:hypothetical protein